MLKKIFSIADYNNTHKIIRILGIKIKFPKPEIAKLHNDSNYIKFARNKVDITKLPPAEGFQRELQLANLALLKEFDYVCKKNNLLYWLDFGTLLGAYRHKGFVPWDDDIDIGMMRQDYNKLPKLFNETTRNPDFFADFVQCDNNKNQIIIKIQHKKCDHLFIDIFPYDYYHKKMTDKEQLKESKKLKKIRNKINKECSKVNNDKQKVIEIINKYQIKTDSNKFNNDICWGLDYNHHWRNWFSDHCTIFPLKEIEFEKILFPCINNIEMYLKKIYGDFMKYPKKFGYGHNRYIDFLEAEKEIITELRNL